jgi:menaquinone-specific isochorismate synthase
MDLLQWLAEQDLYPKVYWQDQKNERLIAAAGSALTLDTFPSFDKNTPPNRRFFGAMGFKPHKNDKAWDAFPNHFFFLPLLEVEQNKEKIEFSFPSFSEVRKKNLLKRRDLPSFEQWEQCVEECLNKIQEKQMEKIVLARRSTFQCDQEIDLFNLLNSLRKTAQNTTVFAFQFSKNHAFIGASPEKLYERRDRHVVSEAIAGTRPRGKTPDDDLFLKKELLNSKKEKHEFSVVKSFIYDKLAPLCHSCGYENEDGVIATSTVQHIYNKCSGYLKDSISDAELIEALHPTPAIGGNPRGQALRYIESEEPFDRGWYASPIGWFSPEEADVAVGIRSALIEGGNLHLFAGTGIVAGSDPLKEWEELEYKISQFL